ncbi:MAG: beta-galactosidase [bacterium]|nr:beta-galactosidase [bacterium]
MNTFVVKDGQFWLDDQPLFIHAGEFHYFRSPVDAWAHRLDLLLKAGFNTVAAYIPWLWHQPAPDVSDVDGHTHPMRDLARFLDLAAEMGLYIIARPGPYIMAETINEGIPPWVFNLHPQAAFIDQHGDPHTIASYLHPDFLRHVDAWYKAVFEVLAPRQVTHGGRILMIQLDNEMGMLQWVRNLIDINPDTLARFATYLEQSYDDRLAAYYPAPLTPDMLRDALTTAQTPYSVRVVEDYRRFYRVYLRDYAVELWNCAKTYGMDVPPVANIHGFGNGGKTFPIGLSQLVDVLEIDGMISATDVYPLFIGEGNIHHMLLVNEMTKALQNRAQPLFSIEFQAGGNLDFGGAQSSLYDLHSRLCISNGMRAINHYLFFDGENDPILSPLRRHNWGQPIRKDGKPRSQYARYGKLSRVLQAYGADLTLARPKTVTSIGFLLDQYMTEVHTPLTQPAAHLITHQRDTILFDFIARGLALTHRPYDALELVRSPLDVTRTPLLWVMMEQQCHAAVQQKLVDYVQQGGRLILVGRMCRETFDHAPCTLLQDALGIHIQPADALPFRNTFIHAFGHTDVPVSVVETYTGSFDEVFATSLQGETVGFIQRVGDGQVMMFGASLPANTLDDLDILDQMASRFGCFPLFSLTEWVDVRVSQGERGSFLFVNHYQDDPLTTVISMMGQPLLGGSPVTLPARRGVILPLEWQVKPGITLHYCTAEITGVTEQDGRLHMTTEPADYTAEITLSSDYTPEAQLVERVGPHRFKLHSTTGVMELTRQTTGQIPPN